MDNELEAFTDEQLEAELESRYKLKRRRSSAIRQLEDISLREKEERFNQLFNMALKDLEAAERGDFDDDREHYIYEEVMELLVPEDKSRCLWDYYNDLMD